jgi:hypothetical protein
LPKRANRGILICPQRDVKDWSRPLEINTEYRLSKPVTDLRVQINVIPTMSGGKINIPSTPVAVQELAARLIYGPILDLPRKCNLEKFRRFFVEKLWKARIPGFASVDAAEQRYWQETTDSRRGPAASDPCARCPGKGIAWLTLSRGFRRIRMNQKNLDKPTLASV